MSIHMTIAETRRVLRTADGTEIAELRAVKNAKIKCHSERSSNVLEKERTSE
jgi:hypothetical protein